MWALFLYFSFFFLIKSFWFYFIFLQALDGKGLRRDRMMAVGSLEILGEEDDRKLIHPSQSFEISGEVKPQGVWWHRKGNPVTTSSDAAAFCLHARGTGSQVTWRMYPLFSFSESLSYHIIIPAGDGPSLLKVLQSITYFFFLPHLLFLEMGVNSMTFSYCLSLSNINNVLRGLHTQNGISFKGILSFAMYVFSLTFEGIDQLTEWQVAAYRQMAGGEIDPFFSWQVHVQKKKYVYLFFFCAKVRTC